MTTFKDHFSGHAATYATSRPTYPVELYEYLKSLCPGVSGVWDCATGNGQAAWELAKHFPMVFATDASADQIENAKKAPNISYSVARAEASGLEVESVGLITVAQALHWFEFGAFYEEVNRVLIPGGIIAVWCYELAQISNEIDQIVAHFYEDTLDGYWPSERRWIDEGYRSIPFPFTDLEVPKFEMKLEWSAVQWLAYLNSWSATQRAAKAMSENPLKHVEKKIVDAWGGADVKRKVSWPLQMRIGRKEVVP